MNNVNGTDYREQLNQTAESLYEADHLYEQTASHLFEHLDPITISPKKILDLGSGSGHALTRLIEKFPDSHIVCVDIAPARVERLKKQADWPENIEFVCADVNDLQFAENSFDMVISHLMLHWLDDLDTALTNIHRVLKDDGLLIFDYFGPDSLQEIGTLNKRFVDMHIMGDTLVRHFFHHPILDNEHIMIDYDTSADAKDDLDDNGESAFVSEFEDSDDEFHLRYEIVYAHAWKANRPMTSKIDQDGMVRLSPEQIQRKDK